MSQNQISAEDYNKAVFEDGGGLVVDLTNIEEQKFELIPKGVYNAKVDSTEYKISNSSGKPMMEIVFALDHPEYMNRKLYFYASFSEKALSGTKTQLMRIDPVKFAGAFRPKEICDQGVILGYPVRLKVGHEDYQGEARAKVQQIMPPAAAGEGGGDSFFGG